MNKNKLFNINFVLVLTFFGGTFNQLPNNSAALLTNRPASIQATVIFQEGVSGYGGTLDTFIRQSQGNSEFSGNTGLEWDDEITSGLGDDEIAMIRFENIFGSASGQIPLDATIVSARLKYRVSNTVNSGGYSANVYESLINWPENVAWNTFGNEAGLQVNEYANFISMAPATTEDTEYTVIVTASLKRWVDNPDTNMGWVFIPTDDDSVKLFSSESEIVSNRPFLEVTYTIGGPNQPALVQPANGAMGVSTSPNLEVEVSDPDGDDLAVTFYGRQANVGEDFTIIALPDTQHYTDNPNNYANFSGQTQWIVDNKESKNIVFVTGLGDIVEHGNSYISQWQIADNAYDLLEDPITTFLADGIPYGLAVGNHDQSPLGGGSEASTSFYNQFFGVSRFTDRGYYGGHYGTDNDNHYELFSAGGMEFIIIHFEYDSTPEQAILDWADDLLTTFSDRRAILTSHYMISEGNPGRWGAQGLAIYNALSHHPNLFLMLGGHIRGNGRRQDTGMNGNVVNTLLSDYQDYENGGDGWLRIMTFSPANDTIQVQTYSPTRNGGNGDFQTDDGNQFTLNYDMESDTPYQVIGIDNHVPSGSTANISWPGLDNQTKYEWYVTVDDGNVVITSTVWSFTTSGIAPTPTNTPPVGTQLPDLLVTNVTINPPTPAFNQPFDVIITIKNLGSATGLATIYRDVYIDRDPMNTINPSTGCPASGDYYRSDTFTNLAPGQEDTRTVTVTGGLGLGNHQLWVYVDSRCLVTEIGEANN